MPRDTAERNCCDGRCANGERCPAIQAHVKRRELRLAPGVVDGPHRRQVGLWQRMRAAGRTLLRWMEGGW